MFEELDVCKHVATVHVSTRTTRYIGRAFEVYSIRVKHEVSAV